LPLTLSEKDLNLCAVNKLYKVKGFHRLVDACARLKLDGLMNGVKIYILGKGKDYYSLKNSIKNVGLSDNI
ncbi:MAG: glycosyltransferase, partial [Paludibacteraceae bacterium]|nr:glycosyltransferase [Paludibacteraceae bacterium]